MRKIPILLVLIATSFSSFSCSDNDDKTVQSIPVIPVVAEVQYAVLTDTEIITNVKYKNSNGNLEDGALSPVPAGQWSASIVLVKPFAARLEADFVNPTASPVNGILKILVDDILVSQQGVSVPANGTLEQDLEYLIE